MRVTVLIPTRERPDWVERTVDSLEHARRAEPAVSLRVRVIVAAPDPETLSRLVRCQQRHPALRLEFDAASRPLTPGAARNAALPILDADWIWCLDDDAWVAPDFFTRMRALFSCLDLDVQVVGGPNLTPPGSSPFGKSVGKALASRWGSYHSARRYRSEASALECGEESLILCNLFFRPHLLEAQAFPEDSLCGEENRLLHRLQRQGVRMRYEPTLWVWHERRASWSALARQISRYGHQRARSIRAGELPAHWAYFAPTLAGIGAIVSAVASLCSPKAAALVWPLVGYFAVGIFAGARAGARRDLPRTLALFSWIHFSYGWGFLRGWVTGRTAARA